MSTVTIDTTGNLHRGAGSRDGGQFAGKVNAAPKGELIEETEAEPDWGWGAPVTYRIPTANLSILQDRLDKANKRLARAGIEERFTFTAEPRTVHDEKTGLEYATNSVTLNTPRISAGPWKFDGVHEMAANGAVISHYTDGAEPALGTDDRLLCEYCGHRRARSKVYVVTNSDTGETKQVGSNCLDLFLGVKPEGLWALTDDFAMDDLAVDDDDLASFKPVDHLSVVAADDLLAVTMAVVAEDGVFLSKSKAAYYEKPTATKVQERLEELGAMRVQITAEQQAEIDGLLAWTDSFTADTWNDYQRNLHMALKKGPDGYRRIAREHLPLVASAVSSYRAHVAYEARKRIEKEARDKRDGMKVQEYLAAPGEKLRGRDVEATVIGMREGVDYGYGSPLHVTLMDDDGHVIYWKSSGLIGESYETPKGRSYHWMPREGSRVRIASGTVKENRVSDYNGDWETVITRAKLAPLPDAMASWDDELDAPDD